MLHLIYVGPRITAFFCAERVNTGVPVHVCILTTGPMRPLIHCFQNVSLAINLKGRPLVCGSVQVRALRVEHGVLWLQRTARYHNGRTIPVSGTVFYDETCLRIRFIVMREIQAFSVRISDIQIAFMRSGICILHHFDSKL